MRESRNPNGMPLWALSFRFVTVQFLCPCKFIKNLLPHGEHKAQIRSANTNFAA